MAHCTICGRITPTLQRAVQHRPMRGEGVGGVNGSREQAHSTQHQVRGNDGYVLAKKKSPSLGQGAVKVHRWKTYRRCLQMILTCNSGSEYFVPGCHSDRKCPSGSTASSVAAISSASVIPSASALLFQARPSVLLSKGHVRCSPSISLWGASVRG